MPVAHKVLLDAMLNDLLKVCYAQCDRPVFRRRGEQAVRTGASQLAGSILFSIDYHSDKYDLPVNFDNAREVQEHSGGGAHAQLVLNHLEALCTRSGLQPEQGFKLLQQYYAGLKQKDPELENLYDAYVGKAIAG